MDWRLERKWSAVGYCTGAICGLVAITPAAGFVGYGCVLHLSLYLSAFPRAAFSGPPSPEDPRTDDLDRRPAIFIGAFAAIVSNLLTTLKGLFAFDDAMDIYACR